MKKTLIFLFICSFLLSLTSATIIINTGPEELYNSGDMLEIPAKIIAENPIDGFLTGSLICSGNTNEVYKEFVSLLSEEELNYYMKLEEL